MLALAAHIDFLFGLVWKVLQTLLLLLLLLSSCSTLSGLQLSDISSVEVIGGTTRVPAVFKLVQDVFGMVPSRTLNAKEVVSRGAALQCAMISPLIKVGGVVGEGRGDRG